MNSTTSAGRALTPPPKRAKTQTLITDYYTSTTEDTSTISKHHPNYELLHPKTLEDVIVDLINYSSSLSALTALKADATRNGRSGIRNQDPRQGSLFDLRSLARANRNIWQIFRSDTKYEALLHPNKPEFDVLLSNLGNSDANRISQEAGLKFANGAPPASPTRISDQKDPMIIGAPPQPNRSARGAYYADLDYSDSEDGPGGAAPLARLLSFPDQN